MDDNYRAWAHALSAFNMSINKEEYFLIEGMSAIMVAQQFLGEHDMRQCSTAVALKEQYYLDHHSFALYEGAEAVVTRLKDAGFLLCVVSGASRRRLMHTGISAFLALFHGVITADDTVEGKPSPLPYLEAAKRLHVDPSQCVVVENAPLGIQAAKSANMDCVAVASTLQKEHLRQADWIVDSIADVPRYLEN